LFPFPSLPDGRRMIRLIRCHNEAGFWFCLCDSLSFYNNFFAFFFPFSVAGLVRSHRLPYPPVILGCRRLIASAPTLQSCLRFKPVVSLFEFSKNPKNHPPGCFCKPNRVFIAPIHVWVESQLPDLELYIHTQQTTKPDPGARRTSLRCLSKIHKHFFIDAKRLSTTAQPKKHIWNESRKFPVIRFLPFPCSSNSVSMPWAISLRAGLAARNRCDILHFRPLLTTNLKCLYRRSQRMYILCPHGSPEGKRSKHPSSSPKPWNIYGRSGPDSTTYITQPGRH